MRLEKCNTKTQSCEDTKSEDEISHQIIGASIEVHRTLGGPGLLESIYEAALCHELTLKRATMYTDKDLCKLYTREWQLESLYLLISSLMIKYSLRLRLLKKNHPIYETEVLTYLRLTGIKLGLLVNFGTPYVKDGVSRIINGIL